MYYHVRKLFKKSVVASMFLASMTAVNANAAIEQLNSDLTYSSISDVTWTRDGNLLGSLMNSNGYASTVSSIVASTSLSVSASNFNSTELGQTDHLGALAFMDYLNAQSYAGQTDWRLPTIVTGLASHGCTGGSNSNIALSGNACGFSPLTNGATAGDEFAELFYDELGALPRRNPDNSRNDPFGWADTGIEANATGLINEQHQNYWTGTLDPNDADYAFYFAGGQGRQLISQPKTSVNKYVWALSSGRAAVAAVPEPQTYAMFLAGLGLLGFAARKKRNA